MDQKRLLDLPPYLFLHLSTYLDASSKYNLSRTCCYLDDLMSWPLLWKQTDTINASCLDSMDQSKYLIERMPKGTRKLLFRGEDASMDLIPPNFFQNLRSFQHITILALERISLDTSILNSDNDFEKLHMDDFPENLEELSLKGSTLQMNTTFLSFCKKRNKLRVLILDECHWLSTANFAFLDAYPNLEIVSLMGCLTRFPLLLRGLLERVEKLKILDVRLTCIDDLIGWLDLTSITKAGRLKSLQAVHLENSAKKLENSSILSMLLPLFGQCTDTTPPQSTLYNDPTQKCTCGYEKQRKSHVHSDQIALKKLTMRNFKIANLHFIHIIKHLNLDIVDLTSSKVSEKVSNEYLDMRPQCRIIHPNFCKCSITTPKLSVFRDQHADHPGYRDIRQLLFPILLNC